MRILGTAVVGWLATSVASSAQGQEPAVPAVGSVLGLVSDTGGVPIAGAAVYIARIRRQVIADSAGRFRFDDIPRGEYDIAARRVGYYPQVRAISHGQDADTVRFELVPFPRTLPPIIASASAMGLTGRVSDTSRLGLSGATVTAIGSSHRTRTDTTGLFFLPLKAGKHLVRVYHDGYTPRLVSVSIPRDSGRRILLSLRQSRLGTSNVEQAALFDLRERLTRRSPVTSSIVTREDIDNMGWSELSEIVNTYTARPVDPGCDAIVDGGPRQTIIWAIRADEVEAVEVYEPQVEVY